jgi:hypothetical protein
MDLKAHSRETTDSTFFGNNAKGNQKSSQYLFK